MVSSADFIDLLGDEEIDQSSVADSKNGLDSIPRTTKLRGNTNIESFGWDTVCSVRQESKESRSSNVFQSQSDFVDFDRGHHPVDESLPSHMPSSYPAPICRQFWKAGNYNGGQRPKPQLSDGKNYLHVHPMFLHSNATSHKWAFGAVAELIDNAVDEIKNGATFVVVDKIINPRDGSIALLIQDDGGGMDPVILRQCLSFGFSEKKLKSAIGQYGNGFKTSSMRLGADVVVFTRHMGKRTLTESIGLLSYTFLRQTNHDRIVVPLVDYELNASTEKLEPILSHGEAHFSANLSVLLQWSPYSTEEMLMQQFDDIGYHGTKIVIYNLWLNEDGDMELDFDFDVEDIRVKADPKLLQTGCYPNPVSDQHIANLYRYSLRVYLSILYLRLPQSFKILLRGRVVKCQNIVDDLKFHEFILYKPQIDGSKEPFWPVVKNATNSKGRGVVGVLEANFIEPTHDKQDFEKTSLFQKLEARLREMTMEYWHLHCGLIGYQQVKRSLIASKPSHEKLCSAAYPFLEPILLNDRPSLTENTRAVSSAIGSFGDAISPRSPDISRVHAKRKGQNQPVELGHGKRQTGLESYLADDQHNRVKQSVHGNENQLEDERIIVLMQENKKLQTRLMELEQREEDLKLKVEQLRNELGDVESEYGRLLAESEAIEMKDEKASKRYSFL
ncbi:protein MICRORCHIDIA 6-like isoform X2 [Diospyros lotus]|uniref:protein MICRORCHIDIA 6-like isoform X2 n=1 Tax=Diospyros lotus TaxID=55363 RepID=UPI0022510BDD|nr:protein MICRORCHIDIA 6-like isoform X2 [Diospyros lotus]